MHKGKSIESFFIFISFTSIVLKIMSKLNEDEIVKFGNK